MDARAGLPGYPDGHKGATGIRVEKSIEFDLGSFLPYRISMLSTTLARGATRYYAQYGLAVRDWRLLVMLASKGAMSAADLVERTGIDKAGVSRAIAGMEQRGLVAGEQDRNDVRRTILSLTTAGQDLVSRLLPNRREREAKLLAALEPEEQAQFDRLLTKLQRRATDLLLDAERG